MDKRRKGLCTEKLIVNKHRMHAYLINYNKIEMQKDSLNRGDAIDNIRNNLNIIGMKEENELFQVKY